MRPIQFVSIVLLGFGSAAWLASASVPPASSHRVERPASAIPASLREGDLVFRRGRDLVANVVLAQSPQARFSHVGVVVQQTGVWHVVHAVPGDDGDAGGVRLDTLARFASPGAAEEVGYFRIAGLQELQREQLVRYVRQQLGKPFDFRFSQADDGAFYCTELALKAAAHAGLPLEATLERVHVATLDEPAIAPDALRRSPRLQALDAEPAAPTGPP